MMENGSGEIACVLVIGLGRIGLPQALSFAHSGIKVYGFDRDEEAISGLKQGKTAFYEPEMDDYLTGTVGKTFFPFCTWQELYAHMLEVDAVIFTIGTGAPSDQDILAEKTLDFSEYYKLFDELFFDKNKLKKIIKLIVRTTLPLGGTNKLKTYLETRHHLQEGKDFFLGFVPERMTEGAAISELKTMPKIIGVYSEAAFKPICQLFQDVGSKVIRVKDPITAEFCKLTDNSFRNTLFSYANELAMFAGKFSINVEEVIDVVNDHYERNHIPPPGFVSGYCLSKDPYIFEMDFVKNNSKRNFHSLWYYGRRVNDYLLEFVANKIVDQLKNPMNSCVAILGLSFKEEVDDFRKSHSFSLMDLLIKLDVKKFILYDPFLEKNKYTTIPTELLPYVTRKGDVLDADLFSNADAVVVCDRHHALCKLNEVKKLEKLLQKTHHPCYLFDGWGIWHEAKHVKHIEYEGIGFKNDTGQKTHE